MQLDISYRTHFFYPWPVCESQNELRACPTTDHRQQLLSYKVTTTPAARVFSFSDYWETKVDSFGVRAPHSSLAVVAEAQVETFPAAPVTISARWDRLAEPEFRERHLEYLERTDHTDWSEPVAEEARKRAALAGDDVVSTILAIHRAVHTGLAYAPGSTYVGVDVDEVWARRAGVCQDFAHLAVAMARSLGIPSRYVSGYLFAASETDLSEPGVDAVLVQTHAWWEAAVPGWGWWALDPTNGQEVGLRHVKIGHGRDYGDVSPLRGSFFGPSDHRLEVTVEMRRGSKLLAVPAERPGRRTGTLRAQPEQ